MVRTPSCDKSGLRKGTWTPEEDRKLIAYVTRYGTWNWRQLPKFAGLARCGKSCRLRWMNYLRPNVKRGNFTREEEECVIRMHKQLGNRWSAIAAELPGRTDNEIKNHWHTTLKKMSHQNTDFTNEETKASKSKDKELNNGVTVTVTVPATSQVSYNSDSLSPLSSSSEFSSTTCDLSSVASKETLVFEDDFGFLDSYIDPMNESFWKELNLDDISYNSVPCNIEDPTSISNVSKCDSNGTFQSTDSNQINDSSSLSPHQSSSESMVVDNDFGGFLDAYAEATFDNFWTQPYVADLSHASSELLVVPSVEESEYFPAVYDDLWGQSDNLYHESHLSLF